MLLRGILASVLCLLFVCHSLLVVTVNAEAADSAIDYTTQRVEGFFGVNRQHTNNWAVLVRQVLHYTTRPLSVHLTRQCTDMHVKILVQLSAHGKCTVYIPKC